MPMPLSATAKESRGLLRSAVPDTAKVILPRSVNFTALARRFSSTLRSRTGSPITWSGIIEVDTAAYVGPDLAIKFHVVNLNLYNPAHQKTVLLHGFDLIKSHLTPRLEDFSYDLGEPLRQLGDLMEAAADPDSVPRVKAALATMRPLPAVVPDDNGLELSLQLDVPAAVATPSPASAAPLTPAELAAWQATLDHWDAFIVFAVKQLAGAVADQQFRDQLFDLLLDSRYRLVAALSQPQANTGPDPIRLIFIDEWTRLRTIIQAAARRGMLGSRALEFLSFITAGDAVLRPEHQRIVGLCGQHATVGRDHASLEAEAAMERGDEAALSRIVPA